MIIRIISGARKVDQSRAGAELVVSYGLVCLAVSLLIELSTTLPDATKSGSILVLSEELMESLLPTLYCLP